LDPEFGYKADDKLIAMIAASLSYEHTNENQSILRTDIVSNSIYFIEKGSVGVYHKECGHAIVILD
jgi:hypothetical protein